MADRDEEVGGHAADDGSAGPLEPVLDGGRRRIDRRGRDRRRVGRSQPAPALPAQSPIARPRAEDAVLSRVTLSTEAGTASGDGRERTAV